ncbi:APC family permease [Mycobacterium sp. AT1]|uniref:APC family permease n=1 Tax=Mycobacterium sp. AT1 TaxID=1961706 RepID=UPI0011543BE3|nr:APC family permease [Mycobacterium sp. AT1]
MTSPAEPTSPQPKLRRSLATWAAISLSVAAMGASLAININPQGAGATVGRAVPLTFILATVGVLLVAYGFARICSRLSHAGSVFGLTGVTLGPRAGVVAGWSLLGAYLSFMLTTSMTAGIFGAEFLRGLGLYETTPAIVPWIIALVSVGIATLLAISPVKKSMATLLWVEICTTAVIVVIAVVVVVRVVGGSAPGGQRFNLDMFSVPPGISTSTLFLGIVFGFLSFAGFEAAAALGEETTNPRRAIPIAIFGVALFGGLFYIVGTTVEMLGFGTDAAGVEAFSKSASLFGTLGEQYVSPVVGDLVTLGTAISAMGCALATAVAASRLLFALNRGAFENRGFTKVSAKSGTPISATLFVCGLAAAIIVLMRLLVTDTAFDLFAWSGTVGTLVLLVAYALFSVGAWYYLCVRAPRLGHEAAALDYVVPLLAIAVIGYTMFRNVSPWPSTGAGRANIVIATVWVITIVVVIFAAPKTTRRIAESLSRDEGLTADAGYLAVAVEAVEEQLHRDPTSAGTPRVTGGFHGETPEVAKS